MKPTEIFAILKEAASDWMEDQAPTLGAALAYYTVFSLAPLLIIAIAIAGLVFGREAAQGQIFDQLRGLLARRAGFRR
jgi:membrane protein